MGCLGGIFNIPIAFFRWTFTNGKKGYIVLGITILVLVVGFFLVRAQIDKAMNPPAPVTIVLPSATAAPYQVDTWSRQYYAAKAVQGKDGSVTMTDYWELKSNKWKLTKGVLVLDAASYGKLTVKRR